MDDAALSGAMRLRVASRESIATGIVAYSLAAQDGGALPPFTPGSHVALRAPDGSTRKYSLTNDPVDDARYDIAVKRETGGRGGSRAIVDGWAVGDSVDCGAPRNDFPLVARATQFVFIAGGIGITPIISMVRHLKSSGAARFRLYYLTRDAASTAFRDELSGPDYHGQVVLHHDDGDPSRTYDLWPLLERPGPAHLYCCGPRPLLDAVRDMTGHWPSSSIHFESFAEAAALNRGDDRAFRVRLARSGTTVDVAADQSILAALRAAGHDVPSSCEAGTCGTCRTGLLGGEADHRDLVLAPDERDDSIMICVSRARGDELVLDR